MSQDYIETPEARLDLYIAAINLFNKYYSHPQIVEMLSKYTSNKELLTVIVDNAMKESWDKLTNEIIKLFALNWRKDEIIIKLSEKEKDEGVLELIVNSFYDRPIELIDAKINALRKTRLWFRIVFYSLAFVLSIIFIDTNFLMLLGILFVSELLLFFGFKFFFERRVKYYRQRFQRFERLKKAKLVTRLKRLFIAKRQGVLNVYCTAGYPTLESTIQVMQALQDNGADLIELGMPYSDPLADGPVIQASGSKALENGMTIAILFQQLNNFRLDRSPLGDKGITVPVILMGYMNPVLQYGFERFCADAAEIGIDGLILPDLPEYEFEAEYGAIIKKYGLDFIFLVTPETSEERVRKLDSLSSGFLYAVSSSATTGGNTDFDAVEKYLQRLQSYQLNNPVLVGFGIKDKTTFNAACKYANGAIIGSAYIKALDGTNDVEATTKQFLDSVIK